MQADWVGGLVHGLPQTECHFVVYAHPYILKFEFD